MHLAMQRDRFLLFTDVVT